VACIVDALVVVGITTPDEGSVWDWLATTRGAAYLITPCLLIAWVARDKLLDLSEAGERPSRDPLAPPHRCHALNGQRARQVAGQRLRNPGISPGSERG
jgi:hypothetical protein